MNDFSEPQEVATLLQSVRCRWGVAGGWAIDLFLGRVTREHQDIEIAILREDQLILQEHLASHGWSFDWVHGEKLCPWPIGESLQWPSHEIWCRSQGPVQSLEILLNERQGDAFVFRRDSRIVAPLDHTFIASSRGIPIVAPEIVLLYKANRPDASKERTDFSSALNSLSPERLRWLITSLTLVDPGHVWLADLRNHA